jgi:tRNA A-37 threonylcarbamoyl transferase component Bud32/WD40 repeat protein
MPANDGAAAPPHTLSFTDAPAQLQSSPVGASEHFTVEDEIGRGGVGVVVRARDQRLGRQVALKQLLSAEPRARRRFWREMRVTSKLQHPGVVPILEVGMWPSGAPFYVMKLVEGRSFKQAIGACTRLDERLALLPHLLRVVETIAYAHSVGVIHRDLKPANVILGAYGETVVIDWGLAKDLGDADDEAEPAGPAGSVDAATLTGQVMGTPAYMPREQASGADVDQRADVYALGAMLRELLTGAPPYRGDAHQVLRAVLAGPPPPLREAAPAAPRDLAAVADKAMAREASARYPDAGALLVDLRRFLNGRLVSAYAYGPSERLRKWVARFRGVVVTGAIAALALAVMGAFAVARIVRERDVAVSSRSALIRAQAAHELDQGNVVHTLELLREYPADAPDWDLVYPLVHRLALAGLPDFWAHAQVPSSGSRIAIDATGTYLAAAGPERLEIWDVRARRLVRAFALASHTNVTEVEAVAVGERTFVAVAHKGGELYLTEIERGAVAELRTFRPCGKGGIADTASLAPSTRLGIACKGGDALTFALATGVSTRVTTHVGGATAVAFERPDVLVSVGADGILRRPDGEVAIGEPLTIVATQPTCGKSIVGRQDGRVVVVDGQTTREYVVDAPNAIMALGIDASCGLAFGLSTKDRLKVIDLQTGATIYTGNAHAAAFVPGGSALVTARESGELEYWDPRSEWKQSFRASNRPVRYLRIAGDGTIAGLGDLLATYAPGRVPRTHRLAEPIATLATSADECTVLLGGAEGSVGAYDVDADEVTVLERVHQHIALVKAGRGDNFYSAGVGDGCVYAWHGGRNERLFCVPGGVTDMATSGSDAVYVGTAEGSVVGQVNGQRWSTRAVPGPGGVGVDPRSGGVAVTTGSGELYLLDGRLEHARRIALPTPIWAASGVASGQFVAVARDGRMFPLDSPAAAPGCDGGVTRSWFTSEGERVLAGCNGGALVSWPAIRGLERIVQPLAVNDVDGSPDGARFVAVSQAGTFSLVDSVAREVQSLGTSVPLWNVELLPTKDLVVTVARDRPLLLTWRASQLPEPYPLDPSAIHGWLHREGSR